MLSLDCFFTGIIMYELMVKSSAFDSPVNPIVLILLLFISTSLSIKLIVNKPFLSLHAPFIDDCLFIVTGNLKSSLTK